MTSSYQLHSIDLGGYHFVTEIKIIFLFEIGVSSQSKFVVISSYKNMPTLVQIILRRWTCNKLLSEQMMAKFVNAYMRHMTSMSSICSNFRVVWVYSIYIHFKIRANQLRRIDRGYTCVRCFGEYDWGHTYCNVKTEGLEIYVMIPFKGNIFCVTGPLCGEFTDRPWIPLTRPRDAGL